MTRMDRESEVLLGDVIVSPIDAPISDIDIDAPISDIDAPISDIDNRFRGLF